MRRISTKPTLADEYDWFVSRQEAPSGRVFDANPPTLRERIAGAKLRTLLAAVLAVGFVLPWLILLGGIACLAAYDAITAAVG